MTEMVPELPALDEMPENPDDLVGEEVAPEYDEEDG